MPTFIVITNQVKSTEEATKFRKEHYDYMSKLKKEGKPEMGCRFPEGNGGFYILTVSSLREGEQIAKNDPYHLNKIREYVIREFERKF
jgi:uncharacterized protein YciI